MSTQPKILAFAGSGRKASFNKQLVAIAANGARAAGADVTVIDLANFTMPLYDQDLEQTQGVPDEAVRFKELLLQHQGLLIASPEYNGAFSPLLKNCIDWASRPSSKEEAPLIAYKAKPVAIMSASPGRLGGMRGLVMLRMLLGNLGMVVLPSEQCISQAFSAFDENAQLTDPRKQEAVQAIGAQLTHFLNPTRL